MSQRYRWLAVRESCNTDRREELLLQLKEPKRSRKPKLEYFTMLLQKQRHVLPKARVQELDTRGDDECHFFGEMIGERVLRHTNRIDHITARISTTISDRGFIFLPSSVSNNSIINLFLF
mmetsp:Transcript_11751/g.24835  ORF Transcript_11751/g.24835 Transcript_11751/m.24835 type:complete len:120 (+) Transcript_11751:989-1348(+)